MNTFGGNNVREVTLSTTGRFVFADSGPYHYEIQRLGAGSTLSESSLKSFTVYVLRLSADAVVSCGSSAAAVRVGDAFQIECAADERASFSLHVTSGELTVLIAGTTTSHRPSSITHLSSEQLKRVIKPWGHEIWINGEHPGYALKQIFVRAPHKTSLQYHHFKQETNVLMEGCARLHFKKNPAVQNEAVTGADIGTVDLNPVSVIGVTPPVLHRLEALTDILLYETSTPHLDDVVRVSDDTKRPDGRISAEHVTSSSRN